MAGKAGAAAVMSGRKRAGAQPGMETAAGAMGTGVQADMEMTESEAVKEDPPMKAGGRSAISISSNDCSVITGSGFSSVFLCTI